MLLWIAVVNALVWSGLITALLLWLLRSHQAIDQRLKRMEDQPEKRIGK
jgi:hypothetical protein